MSEEVMNAMSGEEVQQDSPETAVEMGDATTGEQTASEGTQEPPQGETAQEKQERLFRQADVDRIIQERLARERQKYETELKSNPHLSYLEQKAQRLGMTVEQLIENDRKYEEQQRINRLVQQNIPEEYARRLLKVDELEKWKDITERQSQEQERRQKMFTEFFEAYPAFNDPKKLEEIPREVWLKVYHPEKNPGGISMLDAYTRYENKLLKAEKEKLQAQRQTQQANTKNAESSTGSVKTPGATGGFISREQFDANKGNMNWVQKNLDLIEESRKHWK
jgi:hypothetical protein